MFKDIQGVDIIIPVYNAVDDLKLCVESIVKYTDLNLHRVIIIDDKSSDKLVNEFLTSLHQEGIIIIENDKNMGFSATVNKGILLSDSRDVILLNSDTMVTNGWINKMSLCAYSDEAIATVTPLCNNGSICSIPLIQTSNLLPPNISIDEYAKEIERSSLRQYPKIPVAIGFCMYIKRGAINDVGIFDYEAYGKGYGEENDFCNRASELGYCHVICDDTFIFHKGTASFKCKDKNQLIVDHEPIIEDRYPQLNRKLEWYWANQHNEPVFINATLYAELNLCSNRKNIFYLIQADFQKGCSNNIGGTQLHVKDLVKGLKKDYNLFVGARDGECLRVTAYINNKVIPFLFYMGETSAFYIYRDGILEKLYRNLLIAFKIDLVHIHHTMGMTLGLYYVANELKIPVYTTLHDFYYICPTLQLIDSNQEVCIGKDNQERCGKCLKKKMGVFENVEYIKKWREEHSKVLNISKKIIIPSISAKNIICQYYPQIIDKVEVINHGIDTALFSKDEKRTTYNHKKLHIAFVGGICETKGSKLIYQMISNTPEQFEWYIMGGIDGSELQQLEQKNLVKTGWYRRDELKGLLLKHEIDIVCIISIIPETYCYTLSEVVACGIPAIVTDIGALGERMNEMQSGWCVPSQIHYQDMLKLLVEIQKKPYEYEKRKRLAEDFTIRNCEAMVSDYSFIYRQIDRTNVCEEKYDVQKILEGYIAGNREHSDPLSAAELIARNHYLESEIQMIYDSEIFKLLKIVGDFINPVKRLIQKIYKKS